VTAIHDHAAKLLQPRLREQVIRILAAARDRGLIPAAGGPLSINLDLTTACDHACVHCTDAAVLNRSPRFADGVVADSLTVLARHGLRSVILIGGGEPTLHPGFGEVVRAIKGLGLQCAVVSHGGHAERIAAVARLFSPGDWVRFSLDAGTEATHHALHRPRGLAARGLAEICADAAGLRARNPALDLGFSFLVTWDGGQGFPDNVDEIPQAARLARESGFSYVTYKPLLVRAADGAQEVPGDDAALRTRIRRALDAARAEARPGFRVVESTNLVALLDPAAAAPLKEQPPRCFLHLLRQVLTPAGVYGCPGWRGAPDNRIGPADAYATEEGFLRARAATFALFSSFDAAHRCRGVTCLYNPTNRWLAAMAEDPGFPAGLEGAGEERDTFL